jgi:uncharacterized protein YbjT (DUF2867 family)
VLAGDAGDRLEVVQGDVTQPDSLTAATAGAAAVIFTAAGHGNGFLGTAAVDYQVSRLPEATSKSRLSTASKLRHGA